MRMRTPSIVATAIGVVVIVAAGITWINNAEMIHVRAIESVPLFDPESLAGQHGEQPRLVGQLPAGQELQVVACVDTKSDINLQAKFQGKEVTVGDWKAKVQLVRRPAPLWEPGAISSCQGFFQSLSAHA
jgi:hypothetical protein